MPKRLIPVLSLLSAVILLVMVNFTTPAEVGPLGVLILFMAIYLFVYGIAYFLVKIVLGVAGRQSGIKIYLYSAVLAFGPIMLLLAQSLGSMSVWTVSLMVVFVALACFLISKR